MGEKLRQYGHKIKQYDTDNGVFKSKEFMQDIQKLNQSIDSSRTGSHHQNGIAEKAI